MAKRPYHHGNLRAALVEASFDLLAADGLEAFSVAKVARRVGVSTASPYRHFADRDHLLAVVAAQAASELTERVRSDVEAAGADPRDRFAATAGTYVRFVTERGIGFNLMFSTPLEALRNADLSAAGRELMGLLLELAEPAGDGPQPGLVLLERHIVTAHGYVTLFKDGLLARRGATVEDIAERAVRTSRALTAP